MKHQSTRLVSISLLLALMMGIMPVPAYAALSIVSITPSSVINDVSTTITITGTDFVDGSTVVILEGFGALSTSFRNPTVITADVPAGVGAAVYNVTVSTGAETISCAACLTVQAPTPTATPTATAVPLPFVRPQYIVKSSRTSGDVSTNSDFKLNLVLENAGTSGAYSTQVAFSSPDLVPLRNGGVVVLEPIGAGNQVNIPQNFKVTGQIYGKSLITVDVAVTYYDDKGTSYSDKFTLSVPTTGGGYSGVVYPTSTPTSVKSSQLVITNYSASIDPLEPGAQFSIKLTVQNMGNARAQRITMIVGGGSGGGTSGGTPQPGGVSGGSGEFTNFAPVGASNVQSLGDLPPGELIQASQNLIVNVSTNPGAYPMKVTFSYLNDANEVINDEQVITLLVYSLPNVDVNFYRPPDPLMVGQPGALPLQVVNLGKRSSVLGNMKITSDTGTIENGTGLIGSIDAGGYFTLDSMFIPEQSGTQKLMITIDYTDDFNQPRTITKELEIEVMEGMPDESIMDPSFNGEGGGGGGEMPIVAEETTLQKVWRFILGLLGLDSAPPSGGEPVMPEEGPTVPQIKPGSGKG